MPSIKAVVEKATGILSWWPGYRKAMSHRSGLGPPKRAWLMFADHYEPLWRNADDQTARQRVAVWREKWPRIADRHRGADGRPAQYSFFFPTEQYRPELIDPLAEMTHLGVGDVEVHIHHDREGEQHFVDSIGGFTETLFRRHGLFRQAGGKIPFAFIHGNWALDNALPGGCWCGLNNEITLLKELGCYADFTLPSAPSPAQTPIVNTIYWATDDPERARSHETGIALEPGGGVAGDLLLIPGPLGLIWSGMDRWTPYLENGEIAHYAMPHPARVAAWLRMAPRVGDDIFIKLHTHGAQDDNCRALLNGGFDRCLSMVEQACREQGIELRYATAYRLWQSIESLRKREDPTAESGADQK